MDSVLNVGHETGFAEAWQGNMHDTTLFNTGTYGIGVSVQVTKLVCWMTHTTNSPGTSAPHWTRNYTMATSTRLVAQQERKQKEINTTWGTPAAPQR